MTNDHVTRRPCSYLTRLPQVARGATLQCNASCQVARVPSGTFYRVALGGGSNKVEKWRRLTATCCCTILMIIAMIIEKYDLPGVENMRRKN